ncbi:MAG: hypothetical protein J5888_06850, partial [Bacteroidaceae bacterium]|nr:hypothetical protein [Bacteroidaceae bacterium]
VRSLSKIEFLAFRLASTRVHPGLGAPVAFRKRVQRYDLFSYWQNLSPTFFKKNEKKGGKGQNDGGNGEIWDKNGWGKGYLSK